MTQTNASAADALTYLRNSPALPLASVWAVRFAVVVSKWATRRRTRAVLRQLTPQQLADVGLTPAQAHHEQAKVFWQA